MFVIKKLLNILRPIINRYVWWMYKRKKNNIMQEMLINIYII